MKNLMGLSLALLMLVAGVVSFSGVQAAESSKSVKMEKHSVVKKEVSEVQTPSTKNVGHKHKKHVSK